MRGNDEKVVEIEIERLHDFKNHPFKVQADSQMKELQDSISKYGILNPLIVRPRPEGFYEVISGHRRKYAAMELKYTKVPVIIRYMLDEEAMENTLATPNLSQAIRIKKMQEEHPDVDLYIGALDERLNEHAYIVPGLGDAGDRIFGTK